MIRGRSGPVRVTAAQPLPGVQRVYNLTVEGEHVYYVSELGLLAHNTQCGPETIRFGLNEVDYRTFRGRNITTSDLGGRVDEDTFIDGINEAIRSRSVGRIEFSLNGLDFDRAVSQFKKRPVFGRNGNITALELERVLGSTSKLRERGVALSFELNGKSYSSFEEAISNASLSDTTLEHLIDAIR